VRYLKKGYSIDNKWVVGEALEMTKEKDWNELIAELRESSEIECKKSKKDLPKDVWETYSAFANTYGGTIFLGLTELKDGSFEVSGVVDAAAIKKRLFDSLNNSEKVSVNLLTDSNVEELDIEGKVVLRITVPKAHRKVKPVYINNNPKLGCYVRHHEGDYRADEEALQRMWAEKGHEPRDAQFLLNYDLNDIDQDTLKRYRQIFQTRQPEHKFNSLDDKEFLRKLGGWKRDRNSGEEGLTLAGLLMFGDGTSIKEYLAHYHLDYIEREDADKSSRYVDRLTLDGSWSGNLYDFYLKVYRKLTTDIKVRFNLESDERKDTTPVHEAIREALVNTLAHADFACHKAITIVKRPDMFGFRNPGLMRIPITKAIEGGESDCRNSAIHDMFRMVGLSERLGSGVNSIFSNWSSQHWQLPKLYELVETEQTLLELRMIDLVDPQVLGHLISLFGEKFNQLGQLDRTILITAATEKWVNHERVMQLTSEHSREVTLALPRLERNGFLQSTGSQKEKFYTLPGSKVSTVDEIFSGVSNTSTTFGASSEYSDNTSEAKNISSDDKAVSIQDKQKPRDALGRLILEDVEYPFIDDLRTLEPTFKGKLENLASESKNNKRLSKEVMQSIILSVCSEHYVSRPVLSELLSRSSDALRQSYLTSMVRDGVLSYAFPQQPTHEKQGYISSTSLSEQKSE